MIDSDDTPTDDRKADFRMARSLKLRYAIALALVASLSTGAWLSQRLVTSEQESSAVLVNISGRQRMLSQRTALFSNLLVTADKDQRADIRARLQESIDLMARSHQGLSRGDAALGLPVSQSAIVHAMYFDGDNSLDHQVNTYIDAVNQLLRLTDDELTASNPLLQFITQTAPTSLVASLDKMVRQYQLEGETAVKSLQTAETSFWLATLMLLMLEAALIFHPFIRHMRKVIGKLHRVTEELQFHQNQLEALVQQRTAELERRGHELADSEEKFRLISTAAQDAIVIINADERVTYWNPAAEKLFGYSSSDIMSANIHDVLAPMPYRTAAHDAFRLFRQSGQGPFVGSTFEIEGLRRDGTVFPIELAISAFLFQNAWHALGIIRDVSERKTAEDALRNSEERLRMVLEGAELGFWDWNIVTGNVERNDQWAKMLGYSAAEIQSTTGQWSDLIHPDDKDRVWRSIDDVVEGRSSVHQQEYRMQHSDGEYRWILDQAKVMQRDTRGRPMRMSGVHIDITERKCLEAELQLRANIDYLTGVSNRGYFMEQAEQEIHRAIRYQTPLAFFMLDIDFFKQINDSHGHRAGDNVLKKLMEVCRQTLRQVDVIGRVGGEEFAILLPETALPEAADVAERLRASIGSTKIPLEDGLPLQVTVSIGVAELSSEDDNIDVLFNAADQALYQAKHLGRNKVCVA